jgi:hypothetical protein
MKDESRSIFYPSSFIFNFYTQRAIDFWGYSRGRFYSHATMTQFIAIAESITTLGDVESSLGLSQREDLTFFSESFERLPDLTAAEIATLDRIRQRYLFHQKNGSLSEGIVQIVAVTPLLDLAGLCDPPFLIRTEESVRIQVEDEDVVLNGRIDVLVIQNQMWVLVVEEKRGGLNSSVATPQALTYMAATPRDRPEGGVASHRPEGGAASHRPEGGAASHRPEGGVGSHRPVFGMVTNGEDYQFIKLYGSEYGLSNKFTLMSTQNEGLHTVLRILKRFAEGL